MLLLRLSVLLFLLLKLFFGPGPALFGVLLLPGGFGIRVDTQLYCNYTIPTFYDSLIAKLLSKGRSRTEAIERMVRALDEFKVEGISTTVDFHKRVMFDDYFKKGTFYTNFIQKRILGNGNGNGKSKSSKVS